MRSYAVFVLGAIVSAGLCQAAFAESDLDGLQADEIATDLEVSLEDKYIFSDGITTSLTFTFTDGVETIHFPVFTMTSDVVANSANTFEVEGIVGNHPHLHKALDEAFKYRVANPSSGNSFEFDYKFFDVDVNFHKNQETFKTLSYHDCRVSDYDVTTLNDDYESYIYSFSGFVIVDQIEFECSGLRFGGDDAGAYHPPPANPDTSAPDYVPTPFKFAENVTAITTFEFDRGAEKIEFPLFVLTSGYGENKDSINPSFQVIGSVTDHPLLDDAIREAKRISGVAHSFTNDFDVRAEFANDDEVLRGLDFEDCRVSNYRILTYTDLEVAYTGYIGGSGIFAVVESVDVSCNGLTPINPNYGGKTRSPVTTSYHYNPYDMATGPSAVATFEFSDGTETVSFPEFTQNDILSKANAQFELTGVVGDYPQLYHVADQSRKTGQHSSGFSSLSEVFDVDVVLSNGGEPVRGFEYSKCRITDYVVKTEHSTNWSFSDGFALTNEFHFECAGYVPYNPAYDALFSYDKPKAFSSKDYQASQLPRGGFQPLFG